MNSATKNEDLHFFFFPFMAEGRIIPIINMAKLFASRGVRASIVTTPVNARNMSSSIESSRNSGLQIDILAIEFNCSEYGLPEGCEHINMTPSIELREKFFVATSSLARPLEKILQQHRPDCLVADVCFPWSTGVAAKCGVPGVVFSGWSSFSTCAAQCIGLYEPHRDVKSDKEPFVIPNFPGGIEMTREQLPVYFQQESWQSEFFRRVRDAERNSYGIILNSFYELEPVYADYLRNVIGVKTWHIGPISLWIDKSESSGRRKEASIGENEVLEWLNSKQPNSVVYICFGSIANFTDEQHLEIANGIEESGKDFIWVVKKGQKKGEEEPWLPRGFEERMEGKGLIIRGWAPQVLILEHEAVGGFVSHCGWNSTLEAITLGVKMVTWPVSAEQFYNEKLVTEVLRIGVSVGAKKWAKVVGDYVKKESITKAVRDLMEGEEAEAMSCSAKKYAELARKAVRDGGSSHSYVENFINEFRSNKILNVQWVPDS